jgi:CBS domain-containing protein
MTNRTIENIVQGQKLQILAESATVPEACRCMSMCGVGSVLVVDRQERLVGIFTGRDAVRMLAQGTGAEVTALSQAMTPNPVTISPERANALPATSPSVLPLVRKQRRRSQRYSRKEMKAACPSQASFTGT